MTPTFTVLAGRRRSVATLLMLDDVWQTAPQQLAGVICRSEWTLARMREWSRRFGSGVFRKIAGELRGGAQADAEQQLLWDRYRERGLTDRSVIAFCRRRGIRCHVVSDLEQPSNLAMIRSLGGTTGLYSGAGILRKPLLECFAAGVLNLHCGPLPAVRGMNGIEWSLYLGLEPHVTLHHIDTGIDTGPILTDRAVPILTGDSLSHIRGRAILTGLDLLRDCLPRIDQLPRQANPVAAGRQYFQMTPRVQQVAMKRLAELVMRSSSLSRAA